MTDNGDSIKRLAETTKKRSERVAEARRHAESVKGLIRVDTEPRTNPQPGSRSTAKVDSIGVQGSDIVIEAFEHESKGKGVKIVTRIPFKALAGLVALMEFGLAKE